MLCLFWNDENIGIYARIIPKRWRITRQVFEMSANKECLRWKMDWTLEEVSCGLQRLLTCLSRTFSCGDRDFYEQIFPSHHAFALLLNSERARKVLLRNILAESVQVLSFVYQTLQHVCWLSSLAFWVPILESHFLGMTLRGSTSYTKMRCSWQSHRFDRKRKSILQAHNWPILWPTFHTLGHTYPIFNGTFYKQIPYLRRDFLYTVLSGILVILSMNALDQSLCFDGYNIPSFKRNVDDCLVK